MSETKLYGVGGAICAAPEVCTRCGKLPPVNLAPRPTANPANSRIAGYCEPCSDYLARLADWKAAHPREAYELEHLEYELEAVVSASGSPYAPTEADVERLRAKIAALQERSGYPKE